MREKTRKILEDMEQFGEAAISVLIVLLVVVVIAGMIVLAIMMLSNGNAKAQEAMKRTVGNVEVREVVSCDTVLATDYVHVHECEDIDGEIDYSALWCDEVIDISDAVAKDILGGSDAYVVVARYNNGEVIRQKVITLYSE